MCIPGATVENRVLARIFSEPHVQSRRTARALLSMGEETANVNSKKMRSGPATRTASLAGCPAAPHRPQAVRALPPTRSCENVWSALRTRVRSEWFRQRLSPAALRRTLCRPQRPGIQNACAFCIPPADHPRELPGAVGSVTLNRASRHLKHALTALCRYSVARAITNLLAGVKKLWRTGLVCGNRRKT